MTGQTASGQWLKDNKAILVLACIILLAAFLRIYHLGTESLWLDEASSIFESTLSLTDMSAHSNQPPLFFILLGWWIGLWGTSEIALRSLSVIFGILAVYVTYLVGKELLGQKAGLIASFIAAISQFYIYFSQEVRGYSLLLLFSLLSYLFFIKILKQDKTWYYPCFLLASLLQCYTHIYGLFIIASQGVFFLLFWKTYQSQRIKLISTFAGMLICLLPLVILLGSRVVNITTTGFWISQPTMTSLLETFITYVGGSMIPQLSPEDGGLKFYIISRFILLLIFSALALLSFFSIKKKKNKRTSKKSRIAHQAVEPKEGLESGNRLLLILWLCFPIVIPFIASQFITPIYLTRYTIGAAPALYLLVAKCISSFGKKSMYLTLAAITFLSSYGLYYYYSYDIKEQWKEVAEYVDTQSQAEDAIIFYRSYGQMPFDYYYVGDLPEYGVDKNATLQDAAVMADELFYEADRVWLIISHTSELPPIVKYMEDHYTLVEWSGFRGVVVFLFDYSGIAR